MSESDHENQQAIRQEAIPSEGLFTAAQWAGFFNRKRDTAVGWFKKYQIPVRVFGNQIIVDAEDFWERFGKTVLE